MNFQDLKKIESYQFYLDVAFKRASKRADELRTSVKERNRLKKSKKLEITKLEVIKTTIVERLKNIIKSYPSLDNMAIFYKELIKCTLDYKDLKKSLGAINWAIDKTEYFFRVYVSKIKRTTDINLINKFRREYYGRVSSVLKQIKKNLVYLEESRKIMKNYPAIKTSVYTVCIFGFPNVGKSTLLSKLTTANPEINSYPFTTRSLNLGYIKQPGKKVQLIDTPGTLNRLNKMNNIELQAYLAVKYLANHIVYVFDPTEEYSTKEQKKLLKKLKELDKPIILYISKTDVVDKKIVKEFIKKYPKIISDYKVLKEKIISCVQ